MDMKWVVPVVGIAGIAYLCGGYGGRKDAFPFPALHAAKERMLPPPGPPPSRYGFNQTGQLVSDEQKTAAPCPQQTARTAVLLLAGQSNAGNHGGQRFRSEHGAKVVNFFDGRCSIAESPLLGSDGTRGEYWTRLGNLLVESGVFDQVVLAPASISGSEISRWSRGGDLNAVLINTVVKLQQSHYRVTHTLFDQGEKDYVLGTGEALYSQHFISMVGSLRDQQNKSPVFVSIASTCLEASNGGTHFHSPDNAIVRAQFALPDPQKGIRRGANTDALVDDLDRYDDCHFGSSGEQKVAQAWADLLTPATRTSASR